MIMTSSASRTCRKALASASTTTQPFGLKPGLPETTMFCRPGKARPIDSWVLRPMIIGLPMVMRRKCFRSAGKCQGRSPLVPMARRRSIATTIDTFMSGQERRYRSLIGLHCDRRRDLRMALIPHQPKVFITEIGDSAILRIDHHAGWWIGFAGQLFINLLEMVEIDVRI